MPRANSSVPRHRRHRKIVKQAKGYYGARSRNYKAAKDAVTKAGLYAYRDRRQRKRQFRRLWILRINAAARLHGMSYSAFIAGLKSKEIELNRKALADLAVNNPDTFGELVSTIQK
ncbi:MAG TPA: 50S ribosomal protein L20 [Candidatus Marinimicrobia bacterium]|jgi:large subunit ribosomal protein L20|nr:50S ribosomal protein L20 [Candidatus Neomarinimicrobiota bacterium]MDP6143187.1 50S ribosomal protein L20 [Candidatus Neomarinimicrobiota bacterium]MDP6260502.1 50S ribosomal protein L20 [Candidatus Neomarinimicrobiota bacterium]MDP7127179.1 50S ribosomal protein L20 [Candidatus Neomarinimicrobiota bacterium]MDP7336699.1 50S ribosomal protein L20 [Candidatus Neomarinimicrobiota bacterium]|tara:strand:+ start:528 stop:875 length:348 start_codon:yes stop_codon:yes gene_type:complete